MLLNVFLLFFCFISGNIEKYSNLCLNFDGLQLLCFDEYGGKIFIGIYRKPYSTTLILKIFTKKQNEFHRFSLDVLSDRSLIQCGQAINWKWWKNYHSSDDHISYFFHFEDSLLLYSLQKTDRHYFDFSSCFLTL